MRTACFRIFRTDRRFCGNTVCTRRTGCSGFMDFGQRNWYPYSGGAPTISIRWPSMPTPSACTRRRSPGSSGTMKSSGAGCPMCSWSCLRWWRNDLEGCGLDVAAPLLFVCIYTDYIILKVTYVSYCFLYVCVL